MQDRSAMIAEVTQSDSAKADNAQPYFNRKTATGQIGDLTPPIPNFN